MSAEELKGLEQGTEAWSRWRDEGFGSSDACQMAGFFGGLKKLKMEKAPNARMARGTALEPAARMRFIETTQCWIRPGCFQHAQYKFLRASLDGISDDHKIIVEIKCPSWKVHEMALNGEVVDYYRPQVNWQMLVMGHQSMLFASFFPDTPRHEEQLAIVRVDADTTMQENLFDKARQAARARGWWND
jgi:putative phage-type endonuclease